MIIDGHAHACGEYLTVENIEEKLKVNHVDQVVLVPGEPNSKKTYKLKNYAEKKPYDDVVLKTNRLTKVVIALTGMNRVIPEGNEAVYQLKKAAPDLVKQFFWMTKGQWENVDENYERMKFDGLKLHQCWEGFDVDSEWFESILKWVTGKDMPLFIHLCSHKEVVKLIAMIKRHPRAKIIVGHSFGVEIFMKEELKYFDHVYFDLSNAYLVSKERIEMAVRHFGSEKLLMGSDTPYGVDALEKSIALINDLAISEDDKANILGGNMNRLMVK